MIDHMTISLLIAYLLLGWFVVQSIATLSSWYTLEIMLIFHCSSDPKRDKFISEIPAANRYEDLFGKETELFELAFSCTHIKREENTEKERKQGVIHTLWCQFMMLGLCV